MGLRTVLASQVLPALEAVDRSGNRLDNRLLPSCFSYGAPASNERLPEDLLCALWDEAASLSGEPDFGLRAGEQFMSARSFGITGMLAWHSKTAGAALTNASRYAALVIDGSHLNFEHDGQVVSILGSDDPRPKYWSRHYGEAKKQAFLSLLRRSTGLPLVPHLVEFRHAPGMDVALYEQIFGCRVKFSCPRDRLVLPAFILDAQLKTYDPNFCEQHKPLADSRLIVSGGVGELVRQYIRQCFEQYLERLMSSTNLSSPCRGVSQEEVAKGLGMSSRTLQRRFEEENKSNFESELKAASKEVALRAIAVPHISLHEVALATGFCDDRTFRKHFLRWTGVTPRAYRSSLRGKNTTSLDPTRHDQWRGRPAPITNVLSSVGPAEGAGARA